MQSAGGVKVQYRRLVHLIEDIYSAFNIDDLWPLLQHI